MSQKKCPIAILGFRNELMSIFASPNYFVLVFISTALTFVLEQFLFLNRLDCCQKSIGTILRLVSLRYVTTHFYCQIKFHNVPPSCYGSLIVSLNLWFNLSLTACVIRAKFIRAFYLILGNLEFSLFQIPQKHNDSTLMLVRIDFWQNSDLFEKKRVLAQKLV